MPAREISTPAEGSDAADSAPLARYSALSYVATLIQELRRAVAATGTYEELIQRTDEELAAIGLTRLEIAREVARRHFGL